MAQSAVPSYDKKYAEGGWTYRKPNELKHIQLMLDAARLTPPASIIEVACGQGFHTNLLHELGYHVVGNDYSEVGIQNARKAYPAIEFHFGDSRELPEKLGREKFDGLMVRGHSHHHYDLPLSGKSRKNVDVVASTRTMFYLVKPGGVVMMTIRTNFQGDDYKDGVVNNELSAYTNLFSLFGDIEALMDLHGEAIQDDAHARRLGRERPDNGIIVITRKPQ